MLLRRQGHYWRKMLKIAINRPFCIFVKPLLKLSEDYLLVTGITNLNRIHEQLFKLSRPQGQIISAIIELVQELVICNMRNKFGKDTFQVIVPTSKC